MLELQVINLGIIEYDECFALQQELWKQRLEGTIPDTLLLLEHTPVMTIGTAGGDDALLISEEALERVGIALRHIDRGGNITYHGPGQLVGYPIFDLRQHGKDVHLFLRNLETVVQMCLADYGIESETVSGLTGVWVGSDKICSIGIAVRKWITYHGLALNVAPNLEHWSLIHPCGLVGRQVTSIERALDRDPGMSAVKDSIVSKCAQVLAFEVIHRSCSTPAGGVR